MLKKDIIVGEHYLAKVSNKLTVVKIFGTVSSGGWHAVNEATGKIIRVKTAGRLRRHIAKDNVEACLFRELNYKVIKS